MNRRSNTPPYVPSRFHRLANGAIESIAATALIYLVMAGVPACQIKPDQRYLTTSVLARIDQEPIVRVRIARGSSTVLLDGAKQLRLRSTLNETAASEDLSFTTPMRIGRQSGVWIIEPADSQPMSWAVGQIVVESTNGSTFRVDGVGYSHQIVLHGATAGGTAGVDRFDIVNHVPMEDYIPGVLHKELYRNWPMATFQAQAIAARSYAVVNCATNWKRHYDLESTTASQAFHGAGAHRRAREATGHTRGMVLSYRGSVLPAYYSSCCGGLGQDASIAFPYAKKLLPLRARNHGGWCSLSSAYQWGPVTRNSEVLGRRLAAWGHRTRHPIARLGKIASIEIANRNGVGRPSRFRITDTTLQAFELTPESFRSACNYQSPELPHLSGPLGLKSSFVSIRIWGDSVQFHGKGYGHGVGMCQWGAYGMAKRGHNAQTILSFYYPGADIQRAY